MLCPVILAGGSGTRLWPLSRKDHPKQFLELTGNASMLQQTISRLAGLGEMLDPVVICNRDYRFVVEEQVKSAGLGSARIILEPAGKNTAPAVAAAALAALDGGDDPFLLVLPADHFIEDIEMFHEALLNGLKLAEKGFLVTFGIVPSSPETGYGYILRKEPIGAEKTRGFLIERFVEKPDYETAVKYLSSGMYLWNSGIFMFRASVVKDELKRYAPDILESVIRAYQNGYQDLDFFRLGEDEFVSCRSDSIDYAVMEKTQKGAVVPMDAGWSDLGSWEALWQVREKDQHGNATRGDVILEDVHGSLFYAGSRLLAAVGIKDQVVVETPDAVLIAPRHRSQEVKVIVDRLKEEDRSEAICHKKRYSPWGWSEQLVLSSGYQVRRVMVHPKKILGLQRHENRSEHWIVVSGRAFVTVKEESFYLEPNSSTYIPAGAAHRLENREDTPLVIIEVQTGAKISEKDVQRLEEVYHTSKEG